MIWFLSYFLSYMNAALDMYENETNVACISAYVYPVKSKLPETFLFKEPIVGDGQLINVLGIVLNRMVKNCWMLLKRMLCKRNSILILPIPMFKCWKIKFITKMIHGQYVGMHRLFIKNMLCLYPGKSLIQNIGIDGSGTHSGSSDKWNVAEFNENILLQKIPTVQHKHGYKAFKNYFKSLGRL